MNPLSSSKGNKYQCEMCGKAAVVACQHCRVTFYCGKEHQSTDWFGIHEKICQLLGALRALRPTLGSEEERKRRDLTVTMSQNAMVDLCKNEAQKHLIAGNYELAVPGALQALRILMDAHGAGALELVPAYLLLAEANLGLQSFEAAEEFLVYANWAVMKNPACTNQVLAQIHGDFGRLYLATNNHTGAINQCAEQIYYTSLEYGPEHIETTNGYYWMGKALLASGNTNASRSFFDKVVDIWYKFLSVLVTPPSSSSSSGIAGGNDDNIRDYLSDAAIGETRDMLRYILEWRRTNVGDDHISTAEVQYCLALLHYAIDEHTEAEDHLGHALGVYSLSLGHDHESTQGIMTLLKRLREVTGDDVRQHSDTRRGITAAAITAA